MSGEQDPKVHLAEQERQLAELRRQLEDHVAALRRVIDITALLNSTLELDKLLQLIMRSAAELLQAESGSLLLVDEDSGDLSFEVVTRAGDEDLVKTRVPAGHGLAGWVVENARPLMVENPGEDPRFYPGIDEASGFTTRNVVALPLKVRDRVIGVVEVVNKRDEQPFTEWDRDLALALADQAAIAIENARLYGRLADAVIASRMSYRL